MALPPSKKLKVDQNTSVTANQDIEYPSINEQVRQTYTITSRDVNLTKVCRFMLQTFTIYRHPVY